jgi:type VI secretion system protein ImpC
LFRDVAIFEELRTLRRKLMNPGTFAEAAAALRPWNPEPAEITPVLSPHPDTTADEGQLLDAVLAASDGQGTPTVEAATLVDRLAREIVAPYVMPSPDPDQPALVAAVDAAASETMAALLHAPEFQELESAWRSVDILVRRLETGRSLELYLLDISKQALIEDLTRSEDLTKTALHRLWVEDTLQTPGADTWSLLVGLFPFTPSPENARLAGRIAKLAAAAGAPFVGGAGSGFVGVDSFGGAPDPDDWSSPTGEGAEIWAEVRRLPEAAFLALVAPRVLLRPPYGATTRAAESFCFEESPGTLAHEHYLWGCGALLVALALGEQFSAQGWALQSRMTLQIDGLPLHVFKENGEAQVKPCAEILLTDRGAEILASRGITPLRSVRDADRVLIGSLRSLSETPAPLRGRWS